LHHPLTSDASLESLLASPELLLPVAKFIAYDGAVALASTSSAVQSSARAASHELATVFPPSLFVIGGTATDGMSLDSVECFDVATSTWEELPPLLEPRCNCVAATIKGCIFVVGGQRSLAHGVEARILASVETYCISLQNWSRAPSMNEARTTAAGATIGSELYIISGCSGQVDAPIRTVERLVNAQG